MSTIGTNPVPVVTASRPVTSPETQSPLVATFVAAAAEPPSPTTARVSAARSTVSTSLNAGPVPIDTDRVAEIKKAIATNSYPLIPAKISDAMIAAGMLLGIHE